MNWLHILEEINRAVFLATDPQVMFASHETLQLMSGIRCNRGTEFRQRHISECPWTAPLVCKIILMGFD